MNAVLRGIRKFKRIVQFHHRKRLAQTQGVSFLKPNYIFFNTFNTTSIIIDVGCGHEAELSRHFVRAHGVKAYGVDPTKKHRPFLKRIEEETQGQFQYLRLAVASLNDILEFHESDENESGSILDDHKNIKHDTVQSYTVQAVTLGNLANRVGTSTVDFLKLDLEGAEYDLLRNVPAKDLSRFKQIFIEFHHHCITRFTEQDTQAMVTRLQSFGLNAFSLDDHHYLFYWD